MKEIQIPVHATKDYLVHIGDDLLGQTGSILTELHQPCKVCIVSDTNVAPLYMKPVKESLKAAGFTCFEFVFEAGEPSKNLATYGALQEYLAEHHLTRSDMLIALGGGVPGDLTGFAAATYNRGIELVQIATSGLAAIDSSVGGKTAVDLKAGKNLVGAFKQPLTVICDLRTFKTLTPEFQEDALGECIKYGVLKSPSLLNKIDTALYHDRGLHKLGLSSEERAQYIGEIVAECVSIKAAIVEQDEFDTGERMLLNLGHTVGHAIEQCSEFAISHGHAVATGLSIITRAGEHLGVTEPGTSQKLDTILKKNNLATTTSFSAQELAAACLVDKKRSGNSIHLILPRCIGNCIIREIPVSELEGIISLGLTPLKAVAPCQK